MTLNDHHQRWSGQIPSNAKQMFKTFGGIADNSVRADISDRKTQNTNIPAHSNNHLSISNIQTYSDPWQPPLAGHPSKASGFTNQATNQPSHSWPRLNPPPWSILQQLHRTLMAHILHLHGAGGGCAHVRHQILRGGLGSQWPVATLGKKFLL